MASGSLIFSNTFAGGQQSRHLFTQRTILSSSSSSSVLKSSESGFGARRTQTGEGLSSLLGFNTLFGGGSGASGSLNRSYHRRKHLTTKPKERRNEIDYSLGWEEFVAHGQSVNCLALGRKSGRVMVTGGEDKKVNLWAIGKPNCIMSLTGHTTPVESVKFGHSDDLVCAGSASGALKIWDLEAAKILRTLTGHKSNVRCLDFHPYGDFLASGSMDNMIKLWDIRRKGCVYTYKGHNKCVNSVIFSPDGRWIASGGEDGTVKLWDLPAGKMLTEFQGHSSAVTDVQYHPNEFLLASGSSDRTVKFWDLEFFQLVSSNEGEAGVRCIHFNRDGDCLFSGAQDSLKVYGWEPSTTYDSLTMGWGKVADLVTSHQQLIAGTFSLTNVSVYIVDLKRVQPFWTPPNKQSKINSSSSANSTSSANSNFNSSGSHMRRSFSKSQPPNQSVQLKMMEETDLSGPEVDPGDDHDSFADIKQEDDYNEIFHPRKQLVRTPEPEESFQVPYEDPCLYKNPDPHLSKSLKNEKKPVKTHFYNDLKSKNNNILSGAVQTSPTLPQTTIPAVSRTPLQPTAQLNVTYTKNMTLNNNNNDLSSRTVTVNPTVTQTVLTNTVRPMEKGKTVQTVSGRLQTNMDVSSPPPHQSVISIVRPVVSETSQFISNQRLHQQHVMQQQQMHSMQMHSYANIQQQQPVMMQQVYQNEQQNPNYHDFVPQQRDQPAGLDLDEFLPRHLQQTLRFGGGSQVQMPEAEAVHVISQGHQSMMAVLSHRRKNLQIILAQWSTKDSKSALESAIQMNNNSVLTDILNVITLRPNLWTLDFCYILLPTIYDLLQSKYESYMAAGCNSLKLILKNFSSVIKTNITAPPGVGVDVTREERYDKCMSCFKQLLSIRAFLLKRQTMQGKLGQCFRELHILMQGLE